MRWFCVIFLCAAQLYAQEIRLEGVVTDQADGAPIPYVNLTFLTALKGTSSDEEGFFYLDIHKALLEEQLHISSLGYSDTIVSAKVLHHQKKIELVPENFTLDEVVVSQSLGDDRILNPVSSYDIKSGFSSSATPWVLALYFPKIDRSARYLDQIIVHLREDKTFKRAAAKFRIRVYGVDPKTKKPKQDLIQKSLVLESAKGHDFVSLDLGTLGVKVPKEGIYIGLEWLFLPFNWYTNTFTNPLTNKPSIEDRFAPTFAAVYSNREAYKTMVYGLGEWSDFTIKGKEAETRLIPAITVKMSKRSPK